MVHYIMASVAHYRFLPLLLDTSDGIARVKQQLLLPRSRQTWHAAGRRRDGAFKRRSRMKIEVGGVLGKLS